MGIELLSQYLSNLATIIAAVWLLLVVAAVSMWRTV